MGAGALGPVFRCHDPETDRTVAVKAFPLDITPEQASALAAALAHLGTLNLAHPSIIAPLDAGSQGSTAFLVQEYFVAESIDVALRQYGPAPIPDALRLVGQLAGAIDFAAVIGVWHGSLHPRDILVAPHEVRLTGLGVAQAVEQIGFRLAPRRPYSSPERVEGLPWTTSADIFSLAGVAFELLTGKRPPSGAEPAGADSAVGGAADPAALAEVFARALSPRGKDRFPTALAFAAALRHALTGEPLEPTAAAPPVALPPRRKGHGGRSAPLPLEPEPASGEDESGEAGEGEAISAVDPFAPTPQSVARVEPQPPALSAGESTRKPPRRKREPAAEEPAAEEPAPEEPAPEEPALPQADLLPESPLLAAESHEPAPASEGTPEPETGQAPALEADAGRDPDVGEDASEPELPPFLSGPAFVPEEEPPAPRQAAEPDFEPSPLDKGRDEEDLALAAEARETLPEPVPEPVPTRPVARDFDEMALRQQDEVPMPPPPPVTPGPDRTYAPPPSRRGTASFGRPKLPLSWLLAMLLLGVLVGFTAGYLLGAGTTPPGPADGTSAADPAPAQAEPTPPAPQQGGDAPSSSTPPPSPAPSSPKEAAPKPAPAERPPAASSVPPPATRERPRESSTSTPHRQAAAPPARSTSPRTVTPPPRAGASSFQGSLVVVSRPPGAIVRLDGRTVGKTPLSLSAVAAGSHAVRIELDGYRPWSAAIQVVASTQNRVTASLEQGPKGH